MVFWFETGESLLQTIIGALKSLVLYICGDNSERGGTTNILLRDGYVQLRCMCL